MRKIHGFIISLMVIILTGCGSAAIATSNDTVSPSASEEVNASEEAPAVIETEKPEDNEPDVAVSSEPVVQENTIPDYNDSYIDGVFYPKEYALNLGFKAYESGGTDDCLGITHNGVEYFLDIDSRMCSVYWTTGNRCYGSTLYELSGADYSPECRIKTGNITEDDSDLYMSLMIDFINKVASGNNMDAASWVSDYSEASYAYGEFDCTPQYYSDGFIDPHSFTNTDMEKTFTYHYYD